VEGERNPDLEPGEALLWGVLTVLVSETEVLVSETGQGKRGERPDLDIFHQVPGFDFTIRSSERIAGKRFPLVHCVEGAKVGQKKPFLGLMNRPAP